MPRLQRTTQARPLPAAPAAQAPVPLQALRFVVRGLAPQQVLTLGIGDWRGTLDGGSGSFTADRSFPAGSSQTLSIAAQPADFRCAIASPQFTMSAKPGTPTEVDVNCSPKVTAYSLLTGGAIDVWAVLGDGELSQQGALTTQADTAATSMALSPSNKWLYVASAAAIQIFRVHADGSLSEASSMALPAGARHVSLATDAPAGLLFVAYRGLYEVGSYAVNEADGRLQAYGLVSTLTPDARLPGKAQDPKQVPHARPGAMPQRLLVSPSGRMLYVADADGRVEAFRVETAHGNPIAIAQGQPEPPRQSTALALSREARPFGKTGGLAMACDAGCRNLILVAPSSDELVAMHSDTPDAGLEDWSRQTIHTIHTRNGKARWEPGAVAVDRHTGCLYLGVSSKAVESVFQYKLAYPQQAKAAPVLTSLAVQALGPYQQADFTRLLVPRGGGFAFAMDSAGSALWSFRIRQHGPAQTTMGELVSPPRAYTTTAVPLSLVIG